MSSKFLFLLLPATLALMPLSASAQECANYWINPRTNTEQCLNDLTNVQLPISSTARTNPSRAITADKFKLVRDSSDSSGLIIIKGELTNIGEDNYELANVNVDLVSGDKILANIDIPLSGYLPPGKTRIVNYTILKSNLNRVPRTRVEIVPISIIYR